MELKKLVNLDVKKYLNLTRSKMAEGENGNIGIVKPLSSSAEDLSEYTDADESISSAPTEFLAEVIHYFQV